MSQFSYSDYTATVARAQAGSSSIKVGFFKLANDGDQALVRINCGSVNDLDFASVHTINTNGKWMRVSCLNHIGSYSDDCELCAAHAAGDESISKAAKRVYIQMLVSYQDPQTGIWANPIPVIWERPAGYARELATKLANYGDLREQTCMITRHGVAHNMQTTYSLDVLPPNNPLVSHIQADFSAFDGFNIAKHSYWEKTADEIHTFLTTGSFPETVKADAKAQTAATAQPTVKQPTQTAEYAQPIQAAGDAAENESPSPFAAQQPVQQTRQPEQQKQTEPVRNFNNGTNRFTF